MLIGGQFNKKCKMLLVESGLLCGREPRKKISVSELNTRLQYDRTEMRRYLEYLDEKEFIHLSTIGGPYLYGHITITEKGIRKLQEFEKT